MGLRDPNSSPQVRAISQVVLALCLSPFALMFIASIVVFLIGLVFIGVAVFASIFAVGWLTPRVEYELTEEESDGEGEGGDTGVFH